MKLAQNVAASILGIFNIGFVWGDFSVSTHTSADDWGWLDCTKKKEKNLDKCTLSCQFRLMRLEFTFQSSLSFSHLDSIKFFWLTCCHQDGNFTCPVHYDFSFFILLRWIWLNKCLVTKEFIIEAFQILPICCIPGSIRLKLFLLLLLLRTLWW